ncbi:MAG: D-aminoacylase [Eubacteriaceae bacterium]|nr:D-aminoacylase [Eubacteriaceae bacterium]
MKYDLIIKNVSVVDGTGREAFDGAVAVRDGYIVKVYENEQPAQDDLDNSKTVADGQWKTLSPGFIDIHSHSDVSIMGAPTAESRILQGVTTEFGGNCGLSAAPLNPEYESDLKYYLREGWGNNTFAWESMGEYLDKVQELQPSVNLGTFVGHGTLRIAAMGFCPEAPSREQMDCMKKMLRDSLSEGAFGLSSGLIYPPGSFAQSSELIELAKELVPFDAVYSTHMRNEGLHLIDSVIEAIELGEKSGAFVEISHHKEIRKELWENAVYETIALMKDARKKGIKVAFDQYPYRASATSLDSKVSQWALEGGQDELFRRLREPETRARLRDEANSSHQGRWGDIFIAYAYGEENRWTVGKSIAEIAKIQDKDPADTCFDLILATDGRVNEVNYGMCENDIEYIMRQEFGVIGSDGEAMTLDFDGIPHPRNFGAFPRVLSHYCRERKLFSLETAIYKMTGSPAKRMGLTDRGLIAEGMHADMVLFDFETINDTPSYNDPKKACEGIERVYVNGVLTAYNGVHTGARAGQVLRKSNKANI